MDWQCLDNDWFKLYRETIINLITSFSNDDYENKGW